MQTLEYRTIDKTTWPRGEWDNEPDKKQWTDEDTSLPCLIVRHRTSGHLCGYVGVSEGHPCFRKDFGDDETRDLRVHGCITFCSMCQAGETESEGVCHTPGPGEPDHVWWLGFDCAHSGDLSFFTKQHERQLSGYEVYRDFGYVAHECKKLAKQLAEMN